jgi:uncharacterized protein YecT (DUF1311 family)
MNQLLAGCLSIVACSSLNISGKITPHNPSNLAQQPNCQNAQTQLDMNMCADLSYERANKKLNQLYQQLLPKLSGARRQKLITAQQAWIKFRNTSCEFESSAYQGGSIVPTILAGCWEKLTLERTEEIAGYLKSDL